MTWLLFVSAARADQCAWVDRETAAAARRFLRPGTAWAELCEPCGDSTAVPGTVHEVRITPTSSPPLVEVEVDGRAVDLAYVFVQATPDAKELTNLARLVRCPARGVSTTLPAPPPPALDVPVPSPCAQRSDQDGDGRWDFVQHYVYGADRFLEVVATDEDADGRAEAIVRLTHDGAGHPVRATHDDDGDGDVDRVSDCRVDHCTTNWIPRCPEGATCALGPHGLVTEMQRGAARTVNDYACWTQEAAGWTYHRPADLPTPVR